MRVGERAPGLSLPGVDGSEHSPEGLTVVYFTCNHCPYALAWHERICDVARDYPDVRFLAVNPNDAERYPRDSFEAMEQRAGDFNHPYLRDESQEVARAYGAKTTPDVFVIDADGVVRYRGAPDADYRDESLRARWLRDALDAVREGRTPDPAETEPVGCSIKWKA